MKGDCFILIGDIPYRAQTVSIMNGPEGLTAVQLLEAVGDRETITSDEDTTYFGAGTMGLAEWAGEHPTTGETMYRFVDASKH